MPFAHQPSAGLKAETWIGGYLARGPEHLRQRLQLATGRCEAWNKLVDRPWTIMSIGMRDWAYQS